MTRLCQVCGAETPNIYCLCSPCLKDRVRAERAAQGLPPTVEDPETLRKIAVLIAASRTARAA